MDGDRNAISLIQSTYDHFGSGVLAEDTGVVLQNRGACFSAEPGHPNELAPAKRPFHTIIPGLLLEGGRLLGPFGVMGGRMQAQGHFQVVRNLVAGADPQAALDGARFRVEGGRTVALEPGLWEEAEALRAAGHEPVLSSDPARLRRRAGDPDARRLAGRGLGRTRRRPRGGSVTAKSGCLTPGHVRFAHPPPRCPAAQDRS